MKDLNIMLVYLKKFIDYSNCFLSAQNSFAMVWWCRFLFVCLFDCLFIYFVFIAIFRFTFASFIKIFLYFAA